MWYWVKTNSEALGALFAVVSAVLSAITIGVLIVTWRAIRAQADEARALTRVAKEQTEVAKEQAEAARFQAKASRESIDAMNQSNRLALEANELAMKNLRSEMLPIVVFETAWDHEKSHFRDSIRNVGSGPAQNIQTSLGHASDDLPKKYIPTRTILGADDFVGIGINHEMLKKHGMTIYYDSLDGRRFAMGVYPIEEAWKHDLQELAAPSPTAPNPRNS